MRIVFVTAKGTMEYRDNCVNLTIIQMQHALEGQHVL